MSSSGPADTSDGDLLPLLAVVTVLLFAVPAFAVAWLATRRLYPRTPEREDDTQKATGPTLPTVEMLERASTDESFAAKAHVGETLSSATAQQANDPPLVSLAADAAERARKAINRTAGGETRDPQFSNIISPLSDGAPRTPSRRPQEESRHALLPQQVPEQSSSLTSGRPQAPVYVSAVPCGAVDGHAALPPSSRRYSCPEKSPQQQKGDQQQKQPLMRWSSASGAPASACGSVGAVVSAPSTATSTTASTRPSTTPQPTATTIGSRSSTLSLAQEQTRTPSPQPHLLPLPASPKEPLGTPDGSMVSPGATSCSAAPLARSESGSPSSRAQAREAQQAASRLVGAAPALAFAPVTTPPASAAAAARALSPSVGARAVSAGASVRGPIAQQDPCDDSEVVKQAVVNKFGQLEIQEVRTV